MDEEKTLINDYIKAYKAFLKKDEKDDGYEYAEMQSAAIALCTKGIFPYHITFKQLYEKCIERKESK